MLDKKKRVHSRVVKCNRGHLMPPKKVLDKKKDRQIDENEIKFFLLFDVVYLLLFCFGSTRQNYLIILVVSTGHFCALFILFCPLEYIPTISDYNPPPLLCTSQLMVSVGFEVKSAARYKLLSSLSAGVIYDTRSCFEAYNNVLGCRAPAN